MVARVVMTLQESYPVIFRKKTYVKLNELQKNLDEWIKDYNNEIPGFLLSWFFYFFHKS